MKIAVILFNLGGPDCPEAVKPFLFNLFNDKAIIGLPWPLRTLVAKLISSKREKIAKEIYAQIGGRSPILPNTEAQAQALEKELSDIGEVKCFIAMRYWKPFTDAALEQVKNFNPDLIVRLPLYPQYSITTTGSSLREYDRVFGELVAPVKTITSYPTNDGFITALAGNIRAAYDNAIKSCGIPPRLLLSAHGLPEKIIKAGDPYADQCGETARAVVDRLGISGLDWQLCYQSRVGPLKWIGPATDAEIDSAGRDKVPLLIAPIAFVSEHSETLVEIEIEYRERAAAAGVPYFARVPAVGVAPEFIAGLAGLVRSAVGNRKLLTD
jgi:ferrochelatase